MDIRVSKDRGVQLTLSFNEISDILIDLAVGDRVFPMEASSRELVDRLRELGIK